ncbi:hypothetical protein AL036_03685 [Salipiger aestuarii]|uniref:Uncharacterized protein n=1 Tax=Salipiger aestuarii TaxID=568098 RepID=A0A327YE71_9RHOB|nr:hypothetical protein [Salipiger aestuarii]EIE52632.1 hypothetical protein C357_02456 [Citreicella sp. 357]KAA8609486.1 hypothetical protein AL036_03685 [Salipiger aestuarii]KAA8610857.1 hypothetical protein AL037_11700 [Salipiger aestuarii]KAB2542456.1 hypothetical protein AL035_07105 [Salipiger aestuarii]RAK18791.1 hypothetical protein ATI53_101170 [Salipiger aestuarii]
MVQKTYPLTAFILSLVLAMTGYQMAVARAQPVPVGQVVICSGFGLVTVMVDADGQPVAESHVCPDGLMTLFTAAGGAWVAPEHLGFWVSSRSDPGQATGQGLRLPERLARGPPGVV